MGVPEALADVVGVVFGVHVGVVPAVVAGPAQGTALGGHGGEEEQDAFHDGVRLIGLVGPKPMVASCDTDSRAKEQDAREKHQVPIKGTVDEVKG